MAEPRVWSTDAVDVQRRFDYWVGAICECFLEMEADTSAPAGFSAALTSTPLSELRVNRVTGSAQRVYRTHRAIAHGRQNFYYLICQQTAPCCITQHDANAARLLPGDLTLIDSRRRYELHFPQAVDAVSLQLPIGWLETWLPAPRALLGRRIDGSQGWGRVLSAYARQLGAEAGTLPPIVQADQLGALLALAVGAAPEDTERAQGGDLAKRIDDCLRGRFAEPGLCAPDVASSLGISVRTLHRALAAAQHTFAALLTRHRLDAARRMLASPAFNRLTTAEIGRRVGLLDPSHFTRLYRHASGTTPARVRAQAASGSRQS